LENNSYYSYYNELLEAFNRDIQGVCLKGISTTNTQIRRITRRVGKIQRST